MNKVGFLKRHALRIGLSLVLVLLLLLDAQGALNLGFTQRLENYAYDLRLRSTMLNTLDKRIVILDIDEKSLKEQGQWPWPRNRLAHMVDLLFDQYKIGVLGFDIVFAERDESSGLKHLEQLARSDLGSDAAFNSTLDKLKPQLNYDQLFADSLKNRRVALGYYFQAFGQENVSVVGTLPSPVLARGSFDPHAVDARAASGFGANLPELQTSAAAGGYFNSTAEPDSDGLLRWMPMLQLYNGNLYENLGLAVARLALKEPKIELGYDAWDRSALGLEFLKLGKRRIPVDKEVGSLIPFRGPKGSFPYVSASDVLQDKVALETLKDKIVLVGTTAPGLQDLRNTPVQEAYPGVEVHANLVAGILDGNIKERPAWADSVEPIVLLTLGVLLAFALPALKPLAATVLSAVAMGALVGANLYAWQVANLVLPLVSVLLMMAVLFAFNMFWGFFIESKGKRLLTGLFGQYVPPELVDEMAEDPGAYSLAGESRELTVLFSDVRGFTTISEGLDPVQLTQLMNDFLTPMTHVIHHHRGTIDKYMGDAIMAFWGAPVHDEQHARNALMAGLDMIAGLEALQEQFKAKGWPPIKIGVGINSGEMTVGNMGSEFRLAYTVMGDAVNLGSRLEGLTKEYGVQIIVSEFTRAAVPDFVYRELDRVRVKGKDKPVNIYEPIGPADQTDAKITEELALSDEALNLYRAQSWHLADEKFSQLQRLYPDRYLYKMYAKRIAYFAEHSPGASWDGSFTFITK